MGTFEYEILTGKEEAGAPGGVVWYLSNTKGPVGPNLPAILNKLGGQGWEVVTTGNVGFGERVEIILKKRIT